MFVYTEHVKEKVPKLFGLLLGSIGKACGVCRTQMRLQVYCQCLVELSTSKLEKIYLILQLHMNIVSLSRWMVAVSLPQACIHSHRCKAANYENVALCPQWRRTPLMWHKIRTGGRRKTGPFNWKHCSGHTHKHTSTHLEQLIT